MAIETTDQVTPPEKRNPTGKGGFGDNPQNRNPGGWKKEDSISYQYNSLLRMTPQELDLFIPITVAQNIALNRLKIAITAAGLADVKEITDRTEGKAPQSLDVTSDGQPLPLLVRFVGEEDADNS